METKTKKEIEGIKTDVVGIFPVPIVAIAKKLGIEVLETNDFNDELSGSITKNYKDGYTIYVNSNHSPARQRFTIAHEIGHFLKHRAMIDNKEHIDGIKRPFALTRANMKGLSEEQKKIERDADMIAAEILMPEENFKKVWEESNAIERVADYFGVSQSAVAVRAGTLLKSSIF